MTLPLKISTALTADDLRALARDCTSHRARMRIIAIAAALDGVERCFWLAFPLDRTKAFRA